MTLQQLKYVVEVAERGSITEAARSLFISQPSLSAALHALEEETGVNVFERHNRGIRVTPEGQELLSYARQVVQQAALLEERFIHTSAKKQRFAVSSQHYAFVSAAFVSLVRSCGSDDYEFILRDGKTWDVIMDVAELRSEMGILYMSRFNEAAIGKLLRDNELAFRPLFTAKPHIFVGCSHPLAGKAGVTLDDLTSYPCITFEQGDRNAFYLSEEILSTLDHRKSIKVTDKGSIVDLMVGTDGYTISSGLCSDYLRGEAIVAIPLQVDEEIRIGVVTHRSRRPTPLGERYLAELHRAAGIEEEPHA